MAFEGAVIAHEPHRITFYLQELAGMFHPYYHRHKVVTDDIELTRGKACFMRGSEDCPEGRF